MSWFGYPGREAFRAPLKIAQGHGSSHTGVHHWWLQRVTAMALIPLGIWFLFLMGSLMHADYAVVASSIAQPVHAVLLMLLSVCLFWHGALGLQVIIEDYVHTRWLEVALEVALRFGAILGAVACVMAVLSVWWTNAGYY